ncbi:hypothetical protein MJG53_015399 [Ovis ammon polii x Ovis aries]|uniref:Uncharacterized protein n=2 Tax=Ovis TaxID=9935 RepID=A0AAD4TSM0_OVIAM|nr:hypothetical protein MG293_016662 [Ovis ammon polii]KAI4556442.1 hypothetical protein MJT46_015065 [Ovis ammon polii x Ovis aries]KAI4566722.1 hypothetical protein MJG53_015399 [Ovis ammon polii x Ovis aries]
MLFIGHWDAIPEQPVRNWARVAGGGILHPGDRLELLEQTGKAEKPMVRPTGTSPYQGPGSARCALHIQGSLESPESLGDTEGLGISSITTWERQVTLRSFRKQALKTGAVDLQGQSKAQLPGSGLSLADCHSGVGSAAQKTKMPRSQKCKQLPSHDKAGSANHADSGPKLGQFPGGPGRKNSEDEH